MRASLGVAGFSTDDFLEWAGAEVADLAMPFMISIFGWKFGSGFSILTEVRIDDTNRWNTWIRGDDNGAAVTAGSAQAIDGPPEEGQLFWMAGAFMSDSDRRVWLNGGSGTNSTSAPVAGAVQQIKLGDGGTVPSGFWPGALSSASIWDLAGMSDAAIEGLVLALKRGDHPLKVEEKGIGSLYRLGGKVAYGELTTPGNTGP